MVTISTADKALKTFYLGVLADQLNVGVNPLLAKIGQTSADVWGKEVKKLAPYGINGGVGSGEENDNLPQSGGNNYAQFTLTLKNLFGKIELSDKAIRASQNNAGAFVNLLNAEMDGLLKASKFNFGRMLYGDGSGLLATTVTNTTGAKNKIQVDDIKGLIEGMTVDVYSSTGVKDANISGGRITSIDRENKIVTLSQSAQSALGAGCKVYVQGSKGNEITGLEAIFGNSEYIYGLKRSDYSFLKPYTKTIAKAVSVGAIQDAIDAVEETSGGAIDFIVASYKMRKQYVDALCKNRTNIDYLTLDGGYKALSYSGIPFVADRFVGDNDMYLLNSQDFKLHQLCDWRWRRRGRYGASSGCRQGVLQRNSRKVRRLALRKTYGTGKTHLYRQRRGLLLRHLRFERRQRGAYANGRTRSKGSATHRSYENGQIFRLLESQRRGIQLRNRRQQRHHARCGVGVR